MVDEQKEHSGKAAEGPDLTAIAEAVEAQDRKAEVKADKVAKAMAAPAAKPQVTTKPVKAAPAKPKKTAPIRKAAAPGSPIPSSIKEIAMDTETARQATGLNDFAATMQERAQALYQRSTELASEMTDFTRGNAEALAESGRVWAAGMQDIGRTALEETRATTETLTESMKRVAAAKSPTELMQVQSELAQRNMDAFITQASRNTETMLKLVNDAFAPVSSRMSLAAEKFSKAA